jgi:hypothetical protein
MTRDDALTGISERERTAMSALLRMKPEQQKAIPKIDSSKGRAQRVRREREHATSNHQTICGD